MASQADTRLNVRDILNDNPADKMVRQENLVKQVNGVRVKFLLGNRDLLAGTLEVTVGGTVTVPASTDLPNGTFTLATAPATGVEVLATYQWQWFTDTEIDRLILVGVVQVDPSATSVTTIRAGLEVPVQHFAAARAYDLLAARTAQYFSAGAGGKTVDKNPIAERYKKLRDEQTALAVTKREDFYKRLGGQNEPAYAQFATNQTPYTPRR